MVPFYTNYLKKKKKNLKEKKKKIGKQFNKHTPKNIIFITDMLFIAQYFFNAN
jgi:hypothetical protein